MYYEQYGLQADPADVRVRQPRRRLDDDALFSFTNMGAATATGARRRCAVAAVLVPGRHVPRRRRLLRRRRWRPVTTAPSSSRSRPPGRRRATATMARRLRRRHRTGVAARPLSGSGTNGPQIVVQDFDVTNLVPAAWDFGTRGINQAATHEFTVINTGGAPAGLITAPAIGPNFAYVGGNYPGQGGSCSTSLAAGASCIVNVEFRPTAPGPATGTVRINYQDSLGTPYTATRVVRGVGSTVGLIAIDQKSDGGGGGAAQRLRRDGPRQQQRPRFTVTNIGGGPVSTMSFASLGTAVRVRGRFVPRHQGRLRHHAGGRRDLQRRHPLHADHGGRLLGVAVADLQRRQRDAGRVAHADRPGNRRRAPRRSRTGRAAATTTAGRTTSERGASPPATPSPSGTRGTSPRPC